MIGHAIVTIAVETEGPDGTEHTWLVDVELTPGRPASRRGHPDRWTPDEPPQLDVLCGRRDDGEALAGPALERHLARCGWTTERLVEAAEEHVRDARLNALESEARMGW